MTEHHKHPDATVDIRVSWRSELDRGERIMRSQWTALGLSVVAGQIVADDSVTVGWIAGGFTNGRYTVSNQILTSLGHQYAKTIILHVSDGTPIPDGGL